MTPRLKITHSVIERLGKIQATRIPTMGCLYGAMYDSTLLVVGITFIDAGNIGASAKLNHCLNFPTEVDLCGIVAFRDSVSTDEMRQDDLDILQDVEITDNPLVLNCQLGSKTMKAHQKKNGKLEEVAFEVVSEEDLWKQFIHVRLQTRLPLICELNRDCVREGLQTLRKKVATGNVSFRFRKSGVYLLSSEADTGLSGLTGEPTVGELWESSMGEQEYGGGNKKKKNTSGAIDVLEVSLLMKPTRDMHLESTNKSAPVIHHIKREFECLELSVRVDALCLVNRSAKVVRLYGALIDSACRSLRLTERNLSAQLESGAGKVSVPEIIHYLPPGCGHFFTLVYPVDSTEDQLKPVRETFHKELGLPMDRPVFRRGNRHLFRDDIPPNQPLINTHEGLGPSGVKGGEVSLVQGLYSYHHYMQDRMDDDGWGCAYRSLQTLISWFRWQGYTSLKIPTHREIQQCLVHIGDKPSSFIGTKQWIGSTEVSFVLESMLGIGSRIMAVSSGEELASKGNELAAHFATQGTPIMVGGGVLAHTILGVDFNKLTGELKFLILDPHYTGGEDLGVIQNKGWCGWKGVNFWVKTAYYNLCLPQRPKCL